MARKQQGQQLDIRNPNHAAAMIHGIRQRAADSIPAMMYEGFGYGFGQQPSQKRK